MESPNQAFNLTIFSDTTKNVCMCSALSIFLIILFIITPLSKFFKISFFMKIVILFILGYTVYLNNKQTEDLRRANELITSIPLKSQLNMNIICSYVFTIFIGLLFIFVIKSFF
jgi:hypothetical protein